jgi:NAD(P)-dependent dehydrogenase (short-subunit alcohol dehydrogenase family)
MAQPNYGETDYFVEQQWGVNHLSHFYLTNLLLPHLRETSGKLVILSSSAHDFSPKVSFTKKDVPINAASYGGWKAYGLSKVSNLLHARALAARESDVSVFAVHPGWLAFLRLPHRSSFTFT